MTVMIMLIIALIIRGELRRVAMGKPHLPGVRITYAGGAARVSGVTHVGSVRRCCAACLPLLHGDHTCRRCAQTGSP